MILESLNPKLSLITCEDIVYKICPKRQTNIMNNPIKTVETRKLRGNSEYIQIGDVDRKKFLPRL